MEGKHRDTSNKPAPSCHGKSLVPRSIPKNPAPKHAILTSQHRQTMLYWSHWKARTPSGGCLPKLYRPQPEYWNEGGLAYDS
ncbi:MAG: hypothetical protein IJX45_05245 [Spirochaetaceae bacterium]|nr:hypothetical protein [Spirochaetaceae bacterium]